MRHATFTTAISVLSTCMAAGSAAPALAQTPKSPSGEQATAIKPGLDFRSCDWLRDRKVYNGNDEHIANVSDLILGRGSGKVDYLVVKTGAILGMGGKAVAVPYGAFRWNQEDDRFTLASTSEQLKQFPEFSAADWSAMLESKPSTRSPSGSRLTPAEPMESDPYANALNTAKRGKVEGEIKKIERLTAGGYGEQTIITVAAADNADRKIALGPSWFVNGGSAGLARGDKVAVETLALPRDPDGLSVATTMRINGRELRLRGSDGSPVWSLQSAEANGKSIDTQYWRYVLLSSLKGMKIDCRGSDCGKVQDVILERKSGEVAFLSIDPNQNVLGVGDVKRLIPWSIVTVALDGAVHVDASKDMILASTETPKDVPSLNTGTRADLIYAAFDVSPPHFKPAKAVDLQALNTDDAWSSTGPILSTIDHGSNKTMTGRITEVTEIKFDGGIQPATALKVKAGDAEEIVVLGPALYLANQKSEWRAGDPVTAEVCRTTINAKPYWIARSIDVKGNRTELISSSNTPAWDKR